VALEMVTRMKTLLTATLIAVLAATGAASAETLMQSAPQLQNQSGPVKSETLKFEPFRGEMVQKQVPLLTGRSAYRDTDQVRGRIGYVRGEQGSRFGHTRGYAALVGDSESGLGFYPLPERYREGAARYRYYNGSSRRYFGLYGYGNAVQQAVLFDAIRNPSFTPTSAVNGYRYGVFDPIDGVGTPFFAGYYSAGTRDASDGPEPIFGNPLN
jgi:hypothetical protein